MNLSATRAIYPSVAGFRGVQTGADPGKGGIQMTHRIGSRRIRSALMAATVVSLVGAGWTPVAAVGGQGGARLTPAYSTVTVTCPLSVVYDGTAQTPCTAKATGLEMGDIDVSASLRYAGNRNAGTATASAAWGGDADHIGTSSSVSFAIAPAVLSVDAADTSKRYGDADPGFAWAYRGFVGSTKVAWGYVGFVGADNAADSGITGQASCSRSPGETVAGSPYTLTCRPGTLAAPNYRFVTGDPGTFVIARKQP